MILWLTRYEDGQEREEALHDSIFSGFAKKVEDDIIGSHWEHIRRGQCKGGRI